MGLRGQFMGAIIDVVVLAGAVQAGLISPANSFQANIVVAVVLVAGKWFLKLLLFGR